MVMKALFFRHHTGIAIAYRMMATDANGSLLVELSRLQSTSGYAAQAGI
jgi:hypothetical protein